MIHARALCNSVSESRISPQMSGVIGLSRTRISESPTAVRTSAQILCLCASLFTTSFSAYSARSRRSLWAKGREIHCEDESPPEPKRPSLWLCSTNSAFHNSFLWMSLRTRVSIAPWPTRNALMLTMERISVSSCRPVWARCLWTEDDEEPTIR